MIEVLSPDDRWSEILAKAIDYQEFGIRHIWLVDPGTRKLFSYTSGLHEVPSFEMPEHGVTIPPAAIFGQ